MVDRRKSFPALLTTEAALDVQLCFCALVVLFVPFPAGVSAMPCPRGINSLIRDSPAVALMVMAHVLRGCHQLQVFGLIVVLVVILVVDMPPVGHRASV